MTADDDKAQCVFGNIACRGNPADLVGVVFDKPEISVRSGCYFHFNEGVFVAATSARRARYPALRHRNFTLIWSGLLVSNMGTWMQNVAQSWLIYKLTGNDPLYLGWLGLSFAIPMCIMPPLGGALADRVDRIKLLYITQTCSLLLATTLALLT